VKYHLVREWGRVNVGEEEGDAFSRPQANALIAAACAHPLGGDKGTGILSDHFTYLRPKQMVGVIAADGCCLEILPKIDPDTPDDPKPDTPDHPERVRDKLVRMLDVTLGLDIGAGAAAGMARQNETLLDILIRLFAEHLLAETRRGLPRAYLPLEEDLSCLRGRLDVVRQFTTHAVRPDRIACRYDALSPDVAMMQVMKACVVSLRRFARATETKRQLDELRFVLADVSDVPPSALPWSRVHIDRTSHRWRWLYKLAKLFLHREWQTIRHDAKRDDGITFLFSMNKLFEGYVATLAARALRGTDISVTAQGGREFCLDEEGGRLLFQTKPDIIIRSAEDKAVKVIDTKWKLLRAKEVDEKQGISQGDIYQMMAYGQLYKCKQLVLLYPHHDKLGGPPFRRDFKVRPNSLQTLTAASLDIRNGEEEVVAELKELLTDN
jgi:5-methylcytosine-specific restriction enzyme subunit McrC